MVLFSCVFLRLLYLKLRLIMMIHNPLDIHVDPLDFGRESAHDPFEFGDPVRIGSCHLVVLSESNLAPSASVFVNSLNLLRGLRCTKFDGGKT